MKPRFYLKPTQESVIGVIFTAILFLSLTLSGCGDTTGKVPAAGTQPGTSSAESFTFGGSLYVTNAGDGSLLAFDPLSTNKGAAKAALSPIVQDENILPSRRFPEAVTGPTGVFLDRINDTLYVANTGQNAISIYDNASALTAPFSATRVISGSNTMLDQPFGVTFDATHNRIFVANKNDNSILVFEKNCSGATSLAGNIKPCRLLVGNLTELDLPRALAIDTDPTRDILYISNMGNDSILVYDNAGGLGGRPDQCITDFTACNKAPSRVIRPHTSNDSSKQVSKLELPFGIFIDSQNDRLYVVNTGLNTPGVFIYDTASVKGGAVEPERVIAGLNTPPSINNKTQLTVPTGIDLDVAAGQLYVINSNSPNNVNQTSANVDSPSLIVFNNIDMVCTTAMSIPCNIAPNRRIGGDVSAEVNTTLSSPTGVAFDPTKEIIYITNTGANNIFTYSFSGDVAPLKINADPNTPGNASIEEPSDFHYDADLDRLYVANFGSGVNGLAAVPILVYDKISTLSFNASQPSWSITEGGSNFNALRGFYIDKTRGYLLTLNAVSGTFSRFAIHCIPNAVGGFNPNCPTVPTATQRQWTSGFGNNPVDFPTNDVIGPTSSQLHPPGALRTFSDISAGGINSGATAMEVDEASGDVYVADKGTNTIFVYNLDSLSLTRTIAGGNTALNKPHGLSYDGSRNILYVTNAGDNSILSFNCAGLDENNKGYGVRKNGDPCTDTAINGNVLPDRTVTSTTLAAEDKLLIPIAPQIDPTTNILFLISSGNNAIFAYNNASQLNGETRPSKKIVGANTLFDFTPPQEVSRTTGALLVADQNGSQGIFVGQPESPICTGGPSTCPSGALLIFGAEGKNVPSTIWSGGSGAFTTPTGVAVDTTRNVLYVANQSTNSLSILKTADKIDVNLNSGAVKRDLSNIQLNNPSGLFVDAVANRLYVSNSGSNTILAFNNPEALVGGEIPNQTITDAQLNNPRGITVDTGQNRLYVANAGGNSIVTFLTNGTASLDFILSGSSTQLISPIAVVIDTLRDDLYVLNSGATKILVFEDISTRNGNVAPSRIISGSDKDGNNFMNAPSAVFIDPGKDLLYVSDLGSNSLYFFNNASTAQGQAEHTTLSGDNTGLNKPSALFVDTTTGSP